MAGRRDERCIEQAAYPSGVDELVNLRGAGGENQAGGSANSASHRSRYEKDRTIVIRRERCYIQAYKTLELTRGLRANMYPFGSLSFPVCIQYEEMGSYRCYGVCAFLELRLEFSDFLLTILNSIQLASTWRDRQCAME